MYTISEEEIRALMEVFSALNRIEVKGKENMAQLFNSMTIIENIVNNIKERSETEQAESSDKPDPKEKP